MEKESYIAAYSLGPFCFYNFFLSEEGCEISIPPKLDNPITAASIFLDTAVPGWEEYKYCMASDDRSIVGKDLFEVDRDVFGQNILDMLKIKYHGVKAKLSECIRTEGGVALKLP